MKVWGEGRFALPSNFVGMAKLVLFFKPDTIIIKHQLAGQGLSIWIIRKWHTIMRFGLTHIRKSL